MSHAASKNKGKRSAAITASEPTRYSVNESLDEGGGIPSFMGIFTEKFTVCNIAKKRNTKQFAFDMNRTGGEIFV